MDLPTPPLPEMAIFMICSFVRLNRIRTFAFILLADTALRAVSKTFSASAGSSEPVPQEGVMMACSVISFLSMPLDGQIVHHLFQLGFQRLDRLLADGRRGRHDAPGQHAAALQDASLTESAYMAMVSPYSKASKLTMSTPASIRMLHSVLPQQWMPASAAVGMHGLDHLLQDGHHVLALDGDIGRAAEGGEDGLVDEADDVFGIGLEFLDLPAAFHGQGLDDHVAEFFVVVDGALVLVHDGQGETARPRSVVKVVIGLLMIGFAFLELLPRFEKMAFAKKWLPLGGAVSGFFGGLSGHQGAFRSAFLSKAGLEKEAFIATGVAAAFLIDLTRLSVYANHLGTIGTDADWALVAAAIVAAFAGAFVGSRLLEKVTLRVVQIIVGVMLALVGVLLAVGLI